MRELVDQNLIRYFELVEKDHSSDIRRLINDYRTHLIIYVKSLNMLIKLLDYGADPNTDDSGGSHGLGKTVLYYVVSQRNNEDLYEMVKLLLEKGANPKITDSRYNGPIDIAKRMKDDTIYQMLTTWHNIDIKEPEEQ